MYSVLTIIRKIINKFNTLIIRFTFNNDNKQTKIENVVSNQNKITNSILMSNRTLVTAKSNALEQI